MTRYRRRFDILADIVRIAGGGARKTKIMFLANLSFVLLNKYLEDALNVGLLRLKGEHYLMTKKGGVFLERYMEFSRKYSYVKADLEKLESAAGVLDKMCRSRRVGSWNRRRSSLAVLD